MGLLDRIFAGRVIEDFGVLQEENRGIARVRTSALLVDKAGEYRLVLKVSYRAIIAGGVSYTPLRINCLGRLRQCIDKAESLAGESTASGVVR
jgi:hypothetical protein